MEQETEAGSANRAPCAPFDATSDVGMALLPEATQRMAQLPLPGAEKLLALLAPLPARLLQHLAVLLLTHLFSAFLYK